MLVVNESGHTPLVLDAGRGEVTGHLTAGAEPDDMAWVSGRDR